MMEIKHRKGSESLISILENFDKETLKELLENKEKKVGQVVLVEGRPAVIKRRIAGKIMKMLSQANEQKMQHLKVIQTPRQLVSIPGRFRKAKNARRRVRVKVRARQGISLEDIEDQLVAKNKGNSYKHSLNEKRPGRIIRGRKHSNQKDQQLKISVFGQM